MSYFEINYSTKTFVFNKKAAIILYSQQNKLITKFSMLKLEVKNLLISFLLQDLIFVKAKTNL